MMRVRQWQSFVWLALACLAAMPFQTTGADRVPSGRNLYDQQCARCHAPGGEGVKGKHSDALYGDWSIEKLTRYIAKNMPEDKPGTCVGGDAEAVARFIHDAFYSREARARNHPARVELVRLTNRQYVNTVADLIKSFTGHDAAPGGERGLRDSYRPQSPKGQEDRKPIERIDRQVNFAFDASGPDAERLGTGTNEFSITWHGAVIAEETGDLGMHFTPVTPTGSVGPVWPTIIPAH